MYYPVMNVTQCEGQLSTYHLNGGSMTTSQSEEKKRKKKKKKKKKGEPPQKGHTISFDAFYSWLFFVYT